MNDILVWINSQPEWFWPCMGWMVIALLLFVQNILLTNLVDEYKEICDDGVRIIEELTYYIDILLEKGKGL